MLNTSAKFNRDLKYGKVLECRVCEKFCKPIDKDSFVVEGKEKGWDIVMPGILPWGNIKIEVKRDEKCKETDNVVFEISSRGEPSGIEATKADWWFHWSGIKLYAIKVSELKEWLKLFKPVTIGGDDNAQVMYKIPASEFEIQAKVLWERNSKK